MKRKRPHIFIGILFYTFLVLSCGNNTVPDETEISGQEHEHDSQTEDGEEHEHEAEHDLISLDDKTLDLIDLKVEMVQLGNVDVYVSAPGKIMADENRIAHIGPVIPARIHEVLFNLGDRVKKGEELVCLESTELGEKRAAYDRAVAKLEIAVADYNRKKKLHEENVISEKALLESELQKKNAEINAEYTRKMLLIAGLTEDEINSPPTAHGSVSVCTVHLHSPIDGIIIERKAKKGQKVDKPDCLFEIADLSKVWIEADIFEKDLSKIKIGDVIRVKVSAFPGEVFMGKIFFIGYTMNEETRTIKVRSEVDNPELKLRPGMFSSIEIVTGVKEDVVIVPKSAVLDDENLKIVFVKEGNDYHRHVVKVGVESGNYMEIVEGLKAGDLVVTQGNYQLKSKAMMGQVDVHAGHTH